MTKHLTRREMLKLSGTLAAGSLLAACAPKETPAPTAIPTVAPTAAAQAATEAPTAPPSVPDVTDVVVMYKDHELTEEWQNAFMEKYPQFRVEFVEDDLTQAFAMFAAGNPPDVIRVQAPTVPQWRARDMLLELTPYFDASGVLDVDDLTAINDAYLAEDPLRIGAGSKRYGMCKDASPDTTLFAYKPAFDAAGLDFPDETTVLTYQELCDMARQLAQFDGDRTVMFGFDYDRFWIDRIMENILAEKGEGLFSEDYARFSLTDSAFKKEVAQYFYDMSADKLCESVINPSPDWIGADFDKGIVAIVQYGFWYGAWIKMMEMNPEHIVMLPGPTWTGVRRDPTMTATGTIISKATKVPDAAWKFFEWWSGEEPSVDRATSGWGFPALKSQYDLIPNETDMDKMFLRVVMAEVELATPPMQFNPYINESAIYASWDTNLELAMNGELTFDAMLENVEFEVNTAIQDGIDAIG